MSIVLDKIYKRLGKLLVVNNFSLEIFDGELFVLLGSSGSGKSTLLRIIAGLIKTDSGTIHIKGNDVTNLAPQKRNTGFVFQNYSVFQHMTVEENVEFGLRIRKVPAKERKIKSTELIDLTGLTGLESRTAIQLSGGQQQRVAVARALAYEPMVLLLDEPFGALDIKIRAQLRRSLKLIQSKLKVTTILVTHDQEEAYELADRIGIINHGQLIEVNSSEELYYHPRSEYTATFIGGGNVIAGRKIRNQIKVGSISLPFPENAPQHDENAPVKILFRPETTILSRNEFTEEDKIFKLGKGVIKDIKFSGNYYKIITELNELRGSQPVIPRLRYGQKAINIETVISGARLETEHYQLNKEYWIGIKQYHVLEPSGLKLLVYHDKLSVESPAAEFGLNLAKESGGSVHLLSIVKSSEQMPKIRSRLEKLKTSWQQKLINSTINVRKGSYTEEVIKEAQEGFYEIIIFDLTEGIRDFVERKMHLLLSLKIPVLLVKNNHSQIRRILICTAGGEPGKGDIRFGSRVARLTGADVVLFHVAHTYKSSEELRRAEYHLELGKITLDALDIKSDIKIELHDNIVGRIISETGKNEYDLIVMGASFPRVSRFFSLPNITNQIISKAQIPVLIVPMEDR